MPALLISIWAGFVSFLLTVTFFLRELQLGWRAGLIDYYLSKRKAAPWYQLLPTLPDSIIKILPETWRINSWKLLHQAGLGEDLSPKQLITWQVAVSIAALIPAAIFAIAGKISWPAALSLSGLAFMLPSYLIRKQATKRVKGIMTEFPTFIDLLLICTEGGLNLWQSLEIVIPRVAGPLGSELKHVQAKVNAGKSPQEAIWEMSQNMHMSIINSFASAIIQADTLGVSIADTLRNQAASVRQQRKFLAEAAIETLPLKLTLVTIFLYFPGIFIIVVLPNILNFAGSIW